MKRKFTAAIIAAGVLTAALLSSVLLTIEPANTVQLGSVTVEILDRTFTEIPASTALTALQTVAAREPELQLDTHTYPGMGVLVTSMYGLENGTNNMYWQYTVNGVAPMVGADAYQLVPGDRMRWDFTRASY